MRSDFYAGTFDDPCWFPIDAQASKHIFLGVARSDTIIPAGLSNFVEHATTNEEESREATVFGAPQEIGSGPGKSAD